LTLLPVSARETKKEKPEDEGFKAIQKRKKYMDSELSALLYRIAAKTGDRSNKGARVNDPDF
jgi:hypothetical protein